MMALLTMEMHLSIVEKEWCAVRENVSLSPQFQMLFLSGERTHLVGSTMTRVEILMGQIQAGEQGKYKS